MAKLTKFGTRYSENMRRAAAVAEELAERLRSPEALVTQRALEIETSDKVAQQLGQALAKALSEGSPRKVQVVYDLPRNEYLVTINPLKETWVVTEETLAVNTRSVSGFHTWIKAVAARLRVLLENSERRVNTTVTDNGWIESLLRPTSAEDRAQISADAIAELESFGVCRRVAYDGAQSFIWSGLTPAQQQAEEQAAIESIKKALSDG